jgi:hypothetical protein
MKHELTDLRQREPDQLRTPDELQALHGMLGIETVA